MKTLCLIACHTDTKLKLNCTKSNIKYFKQIADKICIINSNNVLGDELKSAINDDSIDYSFEDNDVFLLCHGKWYNWLKNNKYSEYDNIILANDSFLVINSLKRFKNTFIAQKIDVLAVVNNREIKYHHQDFLKIYDKKCIPKLLQYYSDRFSTYDRLSGNAYDYAVLTEVESTFLFTDVDCLYNIDLRFKKNINFDHNLLMYCIMHQGYPIVKIKKLLYTTYDSEPDDFDPSIYRSMYKDLSHFNDKEAEKHFIEYGMEEGRCYKPNQQINRPEHLQELMNKEGVSDE